MFGHLASVGASSMPKRLIPCGFAFALVVGLSATPAGATSLADYYRTMYTMKFCTTATEAAATEASTEGTTTTEGETPTGTETTSTGSEPEVVADPEGTQTEDEQTIRLPVDQEFIDIDATSEDIAPIFEQLNAEYNADPQAFCEQNAADAQATIEETN